MTEYLLLSKWRELSGSDVNIYLSDEGVTTLLGQTTAPCIIISGQVLLPYIATVTTAPESTVPESTSPIV